MSPGRKGRRGWRRGRGGFQHGEAHDCGESPGPSLSAAPQRLVSSSESMSVVYLRAVAVSMASAAVSMAYNALKFCNLFHNSPRATARHLAPLRSSFYRPRLQPANGERPELRLAPVKGDQRKGGVGSNSRDLTPPLQSRYRPDLHRQISILARSLTAFVFCRLNSAPSRS